jgi:hypothetical protein
MTQLRRVPALAAILLVSFALTALAQMPYRSAAVVSATDLVHPIRSVAYGIVVLDVSLDASGAVSKTRAMRDIASLTSPAKSAVQAWTFQPAVIEGHPGPSHMLMAFGFPPAASFPRYPEFKPLSPQAEPNPKENFSYTSPGIVSVAYAEYPVNSVASGSVVIQLTLGTDGNPSEVQVIRGLVPCTSFALAPAKKWRFQPAMFEGNPVSSKFAIDFVFQPPLSSSE